MKNFTIRSAEYDKLFSALKLRVRSTNMCLSLVKTAAGTSSSHQFCLFVAMMPQEKIPIPHIKCQSLLVHMNNETQSLLVEMGENIIG
jgi:hypothetical protein